MRETRPEGLVLVPRSKEHLVTIGIRTRTVLSLQEVKEWSHNIKGELAQEMERVISTHTSSSLSMGALSRLTSSLTRIKLLQPKSSINLSSKLK